MFGTYFYNKNIRNIVILFGTVFNDISVRRTNAADVVQEEIKVPIAYGPAEKFLVRLREATDISRGKVGLTLPRMSFEFTAINYDSTRKLTTTKQFKAVHATDSAKLKRVYTPVPYNFDFTLSINNIQLSNLFVIQIYPEIFYFNFTGNIDGLSIANKIEVSNHDFPVSFTSQVIYPLWTNMSDL